MRNWTISVVVLLSVLLWGCENIPIPIPIPPNPYDPPELCVEACENLARLLCPGWRGSPGSDEVFGTPDDVPCVDVCALIVADPTVTLYQQCTAQAASCEAVEACFGI